jgi:putative flavoprotein involved in K+ transport
MTIDTPIGRKLCAHARSHGIPLARVKPPDLLAAGVERVSARTVGVRDGRPLLDDGRVLDATNVIWCTGFRPDFSWIQLPVFGPDGYPRHRRGVVAAAPGLYFVGLICLRAVASALVGGVGRDAAYVADQIASRAGVRAHSHEKRAAYATR